MSAFHKIMVFLVSASLIVASFLFGVDRGFELGVTANDTSVFEKGRVFGRQEGKSIGMEKGIESSANTLNELCQSETPFRFTVNGPIYMCVRAVKKDVINL